MCSEDGFLVEALNSEFGRRYLFPGRRETCRLGNEIGSSPTLWSLLVAGLIDQMGLPQRGSIGWLVGGWWLVGGCTWTKSEIPESMFCITE